MSTCVIANDHIELYVVLALVDLLYFACVRSGSSILRVDLDRICAVFKYLRFQSSRIKDISCCIHVLSAQRSLCLINFRENIP